MARYRKTAPRRRRPVDGRRAPDGVGVHGDPCPGDVDTVGRDMAHGVGLDGRVDSGVAGGLALGGGGDGAVCRGDGCRDVSGRVADGRVSTAGPGAVARSYTGLITEVECGNGVA